MGQEEILSTEVTYDDIKNGVEDEFGVLYSKDGKRLLKCNKRRKIKDYSIKEGTIVICNGSFQNSYLRQINIPDSLKIIGEYAFDNNFLLQQINIPNSVTTIKNCAFVACKKIQQISLPRSTKYIGDYVFMYCNNLQQITIPDSIITIGDGAFMGCSVLKQVVIPKPITTIGKSIFSNCIALRGIIIPDSVTEIEDNAFKSCTSLSEINIPESVVKIGDGVFEECTALSKITIPDSVTIIGEKTFKNCWGLQEIILPKKLNIIKNNTFYCCRALQKVTFPDTVTIIEDNAFYYCTSLEQITIPDSVTTLGNGVFSKCKSLQQITIPESVTTIGDSVFSNCRNLQQITIPNSVTTIGDCVFGGCSSLQYISISNSITSISNNTFVGCKSLQQIIIPESVEVIGNNAFERCESLQQIVIPYSVTSIGENVFECCNSLQQVILPDSIKTIPANTFWGCQSLQHIVLPSTITYIGNEAFRGCKSLKQIDVTNTSTTIGKNVFFDCELLQSKIISTNKLNKIKLKKIRIQNFRAYKNEEIPFSDFNCIIGKNDTGKTTVYSALEWFFDPNKELNENDFTISDDNIFDELCISVEVYFNNVQLTNSRKYDCIFEKDFFDNDNCICIRKYMYHPQSNHPGKKMGYSFKVYPLSKIGKIVTDCTVDELAKVYNDAIWFKQEVDDDLDKNKDLIYDRLSKLKEKKQKETSKNYIGYKIHNEIQQIKRQLFEELYKFIVSEDDCVIDNYWIDFDNEQSIPFHFDWFNTYKLYIYTSNTPISNYLNNLFTPYNANKLFKTIEEEKNTKAKELSEELKRNNISENIAFKPNEPVNLVTDDSLVFKQGDSTISIPLQNRGEGLQLTIKNAVFKMLAEKQSDNQNTIFAFEEPETHLHPSAQIEMFKTIKKLSDNPNYQVFMTTHSPYIVKELAKDNIKPIIVRRDEDNNKSKIIKDGQERVLPYVSMNEINYIAFDLASEEFHQELYGQIEIDWFGVSNGSKIKDIIEKLQDYKCENRDNTFGEIAKQLIDKYNIANKANIDLLVNEFVSPDKGKEPSRCFCHCVRNSIDHPCEDNAKWKEYGLIDLSIKILLEINNCFEDIKKTFFDKIDHLTDLDIFSNKEKYCVDEDGNEEQEHSIIYWLKYNYVDKKELFTKTYIEKKIKAETILKIKKEKDKHLQEVLNAVNLLNNYAG